MTHRILYTTLLSVLSCFILLSIFLNASNANQSDFKIINYGIMKDNQFIETTDSIPLKNNVKFGAEISFPKNKYSQLIVKWEVPSGFDVSSGKGCLNPRPEGHTANIWDEESARGWWTIGRNCEMIPGRYVIRFLVDNNLVASKEFNVEDFHYEFGIMDNDEDSEIIHHGNMIPLEKGVKFGVRSWFPYTKYQKINTIYEVPEEVSCKPPSEGYTNNLDGFDTSLSAWWIFEKDCDTVPGTYQITMYFDGDKKIEIPFDIVSSETLYSNTRLDSLPGGYYLIHLGMTKSEVLNVMKSNQFRAEGGFNDKLIFSRRNPKEYDYLEYLEYRFNFSGRSDLLIKTHEYDHYPARWGLYRSKYANKYVFDVHGISFYPSFHIKPDKRCNLPYDYMGNGSNMGFNDDSRLISFIAVLKIKNSYVENYDFISMYINEFKDKYGEPNGISEIKNPGLVTYSTVDSWYDKEKLVTIWRLNTGLLPNTDTIYLLYRIIPTSDLNDSLIEFERIGEEMTNDCLEKQKENIQKSIKIE